MPVRDAATGGMAPANAHSATARRTEDALTRARRDGDEDEDEVVVVRCESTKGRVVLEVHTGWAPHGARRFLELVRLGYYTDVALFRVNRWITQFGAVKTDREGAWRELIPHGRHHLPTIPDDPPTDCFGRCTRRSLFDGAVSYAGGGKDSRAAQIFVVHHRGKSQPLGESLWEVPFANVTEGLDVARSWYSGYGDKGISQVEIFARGSDWVRSKFPQADFINSCAIVERAPSPPKVDPGLGADLGPRLGAPGEVVDLDPDPVDLALGFLSGVGLLLLLLALIRQVRLMNSKKGL